MIHAIDPGPTESALVALSGRTVFHTMLAQNEDVLQWLRTEAREPYAAEQTLVIEQVASFGMPVGAEVFETVYWSGRFAEAWLAGRSERLVRLPRLRVKQALCHDSRAKDSNIRQAIIDLYGGPHTTKKGGPLAAIRKDLWAALAVGLAYQELAAERARTIHDLAPTA